MANMVMDGTNGIIFPDGSILASAAASFSFRNKVRNPKHEIARRGTSFAAVGNVYTLDGWLYSSSPAGYVTVSQQADSPSYADYTYSLRATVTTANATVSSGHYASILQPIEGFLVRDLIGNPIAIRFDVRSAKTGIHCVSLRNSIADRSYVLTYTVTTANVWQPATITLPTGLITSGTWDFGTGLGVSLLFCFMCGSTYQTTAGAWQTGNYLATSSQVNCLDTVGNIFAIGGVQLERGIISSPLEHRDPVSEANFNYRYLPAYSGLNGNAGDIALGFATSATAGLVLFNYPVDARIVPTGLGGSALSTYQVTSYAATVAANSLSFSSSTTKLGRMYFTIGSASFTGGTPIILLGTGSGAAYFYWTGAEL
jgi:hypothetical protein